MPLVPSSREDAIHYQRKGSSHLVCPPNAIEGAKFNRENRERRAARERPRLKRLLFGEMMHPQEHRPELFRRRNDRRRLPCLKGGAPIFLVAMFLVSVYMSITNVRHAFQGVPEILDPYHLGSFASEPLMPPEIYDKMNAKERKEGNLVIIETRENVKGEDMNSKEKITAGNHISKKPGATTKREVTAAVIPDTNDSEVKIKEEKLNTQDTSSDYNTVIRGKAKVVLETPVETTKKEDTIDDSSNSTSTIPHAKDVTNGTSSSTNFTLPRLLSTIPNDNNTAITLVAMGGLVETYMAERCIRSIRQRGLFFGPIMLFTDSDGYKQYQETIPFMDNRTTIINSREEDLYPREETKEGQGKNQTPPLKKYAQRSMVFKRFKTHHSKYIEADPNLKDSIRFVMYVDVDNIIGSPMEIFFQEYAKMVADKYPVAVDFHRNFTLTGGNNTEQLTPKTDNSTQNDFGFMSMFRDRHLKGKMHGYVRLRFILSSLFTTVVFAQLFH